MNTAKKLFTQLDHPKSKITLTPVVIDKDTDEVVGKGLPVEVELEDFVGMVAELLPDPTPGP